MQDKIITWKGDEFVIKTSSLMRVILGIEDIITLIEIQNTALLGNMKLGKIAAAYAFVLRYAGVKVTDLEVYYEMLGKKEGDAPGENMERAATLIKELIDLMAPPEPLAKKLQAAGGSGNGEAPSTTKTSGAMSRTPIKPGLPGGIRRKTSGK